MSYRELLHRHSLLFLDNELKQISYIMDISQENYNVYWPKLLQLFIHSCSEIEAICKQIGNSTKWEEWGNISDYKGTLLSNYPNIVNDPVYVKLYDIEIIPFLNWDSWKLPRWDDYWDLKHSKHKYYNKANLWNVMQSISALFLLTTYYYLNYYKKNNMADLFSDVLIEENTFLRLKEDCYPSLLRVW